MTDDGFKDRAAGVPPGILRLVADADQRATNMAPADVADLDQALATADRVLRVNAADLASLIAMGARTREQIIDVLGRSLLGGGVGKGLLALLYADAIYELARSGWTGRVHG